MNNMTEIADELDVKLLLATLMALKKGDFTARMPSDWTGISGKIADTLNDIIETKEKMVNAITDVSRVVGREGRLTQRASVPGVQGGWGTIISSVNTLIDDLVRPTTEMARVIGAVAKGDLSQTMALEVDGHPLRASTCARPPPRTRWWNSCRHSPPR
jgi:methyl-accepting chemotaxis protein